MRARSVAAVIAGFLATAVLSIGTDALMHRLGLFPPSGVRMSDGLFALPATYRAVWTVVGGYVTARLAPDRPRAHAVALTVLGLIGGALGVLAWFGGGPEMGPLWYPLSIPLSAVPCIGLGAWLAERSRKI